MQPTWIVVLLLCHAFATWMMAGIILFVQAVYLPLFRKFHRKISHYQKKDLIHMGYLVGPIFFFETVSAIILGCFIFKETTTYRILAYVNVGLLGLIWIVSWMIQWKVRSQRRDVFFIERMHNILLTSNWFRTLCWTARGVIVLLMLLFSNMMK